MSMEVPESWKPNIQDDTPSSFPTFTLPGNKCNVRATLVVKDVLVSLNRIATLQRQYVVKQDPNCVATEVAEVLIHEKNTCQFICRTTGHGVTRIKSFSFVRAVKYVMMLTCEATSDAAMAYHQHELDSWVSSMQTETVSNVPCANETLVADDNGLLQLVVPREWRVLNVMEVDREAGVLFHLESADTVVTKISAWELLHDATLDNFVQDYIVRLLQASPDAVHSSRQMLINGRDAIRTNIISKLKDKNYHCTHTAIQFPDFIVTVFTLSDDTGKYSALCEAIAWQVFPQDCA